MATPFKDRTLRLGAILDAPSGSVWMAQCRCGHAAPMPTASLVKRFGREVPAEHALFHARCVKCGKGGDAVPKLMLLCQPGCGRQRG